ncbi:MAG: IS110 family transposase, partial [Deltaproteobacteria bacterium]|nr:IS110 family transposase [Deltaproteobacteria bacterium]
TAVAMESTGIYWKPIFNILEDDFDIVLANAQHIKNVPGRKTDVKDCQWIAHLFRNGLISGSFIPPRDIRELRDLTRTRKKLVGAMASEKNRVQKVLEDANIKISSVVSKVFGVSSLAMICALLEKDELSADEIAEMAKGKLKNKVNQLVEALNGNVTDHHRFLLKQHLGHIDFLVEEIKEFDEEIQRRLVPYQKEFKDIQSVTEIIGVSAASVIAEIGVDMSRFPDEAHISSWAGVCPGNNESAGKKKSGKTRRGNNYLKATLTESAWAAARTKETAFSAMYRNIAGRRGTKRALVAVGHQILIEVYRVLETGDRYQDAGAEAVTERRLKNREQRMVRELKRCGYKRLSRLMVLLETLPMNSMRPARIVAVWHSMQNSGDCL